MKQVTFSNFIAFGKRMSIDIRVTICQAIPDSLGIWHATGKPVQIVVSDEVPNTGDSEGICIQFNEMANRLLIDLVMQLNELGLTALHAELAKRIRESEFTDGNREEFSTLIGLIYELNHETFNVEE